MKKLLRLFVLLSACALSSAQAAPSIVALDSGEQLIGEVQPQSTDATLIIKSALLGEITLPRARVLSIQAQAPKVEAAPAAPAAPVAPVAPVAVAQSAPAAPAAAAAEAIAPAEVIATAEVITAAVVEELRIIDTLMEFKAPDDWSGNLRIGINLSRGDRQWTETYARGKLEIDPKGSANFYRFTGSYTYRETERNDGTEFKSTDQHDVEFIYRRTFQQNWFIQNAMGYRVDQLKGIQREAQETVGIGYKYKPSDRFELLFGGGGGVEELQVDFEDTREGLNPVGNIFQEATWRPLQRTSLVQKFNYYWNPNDSEQFSYVFTAAVRVRLTDLLGLEFSFNKSFDNDVGNGNAQDDTQWRNALVVYF